jgi:phosphatidylglycerophosphatase A
MSAGAENRPSDAATPSATVSRKPAFSIFIATAAGLGYLPIAPGTWGSLGGLILALAPWWVWVAGVISYVGSRGRDLPAVFDAVSLSESTDIFLWAQIVLTVLIAMIGVVSADRAAKFWAQKDPGRVVIDEVSGQHLTLLLGCGIPVWWKPADFDGSYNPIGLISTHALLNWKYLLLGFILFRLFDIWKPFPARQAEALPGGWGIMADDWIAGVYAAIGLWIARAAGL